MYCEIQVNLCSSQPCLNGATCINVNTTSWQCQCKCGYTGPRCESLVNECLNTPCLNGGTCTKPRPCGFVCACPQEPVAYFGAICESNFRIMPPSSSSSLLTSSSSSPRPKLAQNKEEEEEADLPTIIYSRQETLYFDASASLLRFDDLFEPIRSAYNAASGSTLCPPQYSLVAGACFHLVDASASTVRQARDECRGAYGGSLAHFDTIEELDSVRAWLLQSTLYKGGDVWTSARFTRDTWMWQRGGGSVKDTPVNTSMLDTNWSPVDSGADLNDGDVLVLRQQLQQHANSALLLFDSAHDADDEDVDVDGAEMALALCRHKAFVFDASNMQMTLIEQLTAIEFSQVEVSLFYN